MKLHVQGFAEASAEGGYELGSAVGGDMIGNAVLGEDVDHEESCESFGVDFLRERNKDSLFGCAINNHKDRSVAIGVRKLFDEV